MGLPALPKGLTFENKSVLITGSNSGIGRELARLVLRHKAKTVYIVVRSVEKGNAAIELLKQDEIVQKENPGAEIVLYQCDHASFESTRAFAKKFKEEVKSLDYAVLNAGVNNFSWVPTANDWDSVFHVNYFSTAFIGLELLPLLKASGKDGAPGHLFTTSSMMHKQYSWDSKKLLQDDVNILSYFGDKENRPMNPNTPYCSSKLCITSFMEELAKHEKDVVITTGCPGVVITDFDRGLPFLLRGPVVLVKRLIGREAYTAAEVLVPAMITDKNGSYWADGVITPHAKVMDYDESKLVQTKLYEQTLVKCKELDPDLVVPA